MFINIQQIEKQTRNQVNKVIENFKGIVVVDEAYYDFSRKSFVNQIEKHISNLLD